MNKLKRVLLTIFLFGAVIAPAAQPVTADNYTVNADGIINVCDFGADRADRSILMSSRFSSQQEIDDIYGADRYRLDDEVDYVAFCEALRAALRYSPRRANLDASVENAQIYLPGGTFNINRTIRIDHVYGLIIAGSGRNNTFFKFEQPGETLFSVTSSGSIWFRDFEVKSKIAAKCTAFHFDQVFPQNSLPVFKFKFDSIGCMWLYRGMYFTGNAMVCEMTFVNCRFTQCLKGMQIANNQALNFHLFGCDFEAHGDEALYAPFSKKESVYIHCEAGGMVNCVGGSIIHGGRTLLLEPLPEFKGDAINIGNGLFNFVGVRWEQEGTEVPFLFDRIGNGSAIRATINLIGCICYQKLASRNSELGRITDGMDVSITDSCFNFGYFTGAITPETAKHNGSLTVSNSKFFEYRENRPEGVDPEEKLHHAVSYRSAGFRTTDQNMRNINPEQLVSFDISANNTGAAEVKILKQMVDQPTGMREYRVFLPGFATLRQVRFVSDHELGDNRATLAVLNVENKQTLAENSSGNNRRAVAIDNLDAFSIKNYQELRIRLTGENSGLSGKLLYEYY